MLTTLQSFTASWQTKVRPRRDTSMKLLFIKSAFGVITGVVLGAIPITGIIGFMIFVPFQYVLSQLYCTQMKIPDYVIDRFDIFAEHTPAALGLFLVFYNLILLYTSFRSAG